MHEHHLLYLYRHIAMLVIVMVHNCHSWVGLFISLLPWKLTDYCLVRWKLDHKEEVFRLDVDRIIQVLFLKYAVSSAMGAYFQI